MQKSVVPRKAAVVVLIRPAPKGDGPDAPAEVFLTKRPESMAFAGGNFVFPGGKFDPSDSAPENLALARGMEPERAARIFGDGEPPERSLGLWLAAIRELFEEANILLCTTREGGTPDLKTSGMQARLAAGREEVHQRRRTLASPMGELGLYYGAGELSYLTRWITPMYSPIRFDARYFLCQIPPEQVAEPCRHEVTAARWIEPAEAIGRWRAGEIKMRGPTATTLMYLAQFPECRRLLAAARSGRIGFPSQTAE